MGKELEKVRGEKITLSVKGEERELKFGFKVWAKLEEEMGGLKNLEKLEKQIEEKPFNTLPHLFYLALVDKEGVSEDDVLDDYGLTDIEELAEKFNKLVYGSLPVDEKKAVKEAKK